MIIVKNTKELEERYNLEAIPDYEQIRIIGGMYGKEKYNKEKYIQRTTYPAWQIKEIIGIMHQIEEKIPANFNSWQRAKYLYEILGNNVEYNYDKSTYGNQQSSNLTVLLSGKGICAGYALTYKEMMDRQGIYCDYIRGTAYNLNHEPEKHAWNVIIIDGKPIPVDATWDAIRIQKGGELKCFGDKNFSKEHITDSDEYQYSLYYLPDNGKSINIENEQKKEELSLQQKEQLLNFAIEETYKKFKNYGGDKARAQVIGAIEMLIKEENLNGFTRQSGARDGIRKLSKEDITNIMAKNHVRIAINKAVVQTSLDNAIVQTFNKYGYQQSIEAVHDYLVAGFTRQIYKGKQCKKRYRRRYNRVSLE